MKKIHFLLAILLTVPSIVSAHVKWFVDSQEVITTSHALTPFYNITSKEIFIWSIISAAVVLMFAFVDKKIKAPKKLLAFGITHEKKINRVAQIILGLFLVSVSFLWKIVILPDFHVNNLFGTVLQYVQVLIGLMFVFNLKPRTASISLVIMTLGICLSSEEGIVAVLENALLLSLGIYFFIVNSKEDSTAFTWHKHAIEIVRIGTGISLITLAFTEKLLYPELSLAFLDTHHWNFMQSIAPWFTNNLFVLSTGFAEMIFGILFIMGYITRITTILIAIFFALSVTTMLLQFGAWEVEDLVVYAAAVLLLFFGHGRTKFFHFKLGK
jgi:uncharacterized membrane protein YphA (DoxX/SURF4 family)